MRLVKALFWALIAFGILKAGQTRSEYVKISKYELVKTKVDSFLYLLEKLEIENGEVVLAQAILETGNFKSKIFLENNNAYGMKFNKRGWAKGTRNGHAYYENVLDSFYDYKAWQDNVKRIHGGEMSDEEYLRALNSPYKDHRRYAEDRRYVEKLRILIKKIRLCRSVVAES
jgi:Mannosyl-glycoprotein endo-beta-N-acetylglucosaminidase